MTQLYVVSRRPSSEQGTQDESLGVGEYCPCKWVAILISDKIDFKMKAITRDNEGHCTILKRLIQQEDIKLVNMYAPNIGAPRYIRKRQEDFKGEIDNNQY